MYELWVESRTMYGKKRKFYDRWASSWSISWKYILTLVSLVLNDHSPEKRTFYMSHKQLNIVESTCTTINSFVLLHLSRLLQCRTYLWKRYVCNTLYQVPCSLNFSGSGSRSDSSFQMNNFLTFSHYLKIKKKILVYLSTW